MTTKHQRQVIREAAVAQLKGVSPAFKTMAGARVYETRMVPWRNQELPAISVFSGDESVDDQQSAPRELKRKLDLTIDAVVIASEDLDDVLDAFALEVERAMHADPTLGGAASDTVLKRTTIGTMVEGNRPIGAVQLVYETTYYTNAPEASDTTLDDLETVTSKTSLSGLQAVAEQAQDVVNLSES